MIVQVTFQSTGHVPFSWCRCWQVAFSMGIVFGLSTKQHWLDAAIWDWFSL